MTGSKRVDHWTTETVFMNAVRLQALHRAPPVADYVGCEARENLSEGETGTEELGEIKWRYHIVGMTA